MTAEIAVLNRFGVSMAADSAITVEVFHDGTVRSKVYNSANKIFSLSKFAPVGVMFYNAVSLSGVPWETIIKSYRHSLKDNTFDRLEDYCKDFFDFLTSSPDIFHQSAIEQVLANSLLRYFYRHFAGGKTRKEFIEKLDQLYDALEQTPIVPDFGEEHAARVFRENKTAIMSSIELVVKSSYTRGNKRKIEQLCIRLLSRKNVIASHSGIVFAGFGDKEYLPVLKEYVIDFHTGDKVRCWLNSEECITSEERSSIVPFADTEVIRTLIEGISPSFQEQVFQSAAKLVLNIPGEVLSAVSELTDSQKRAYEQNAIKVLVDHFTRYKGEMNDFRDRRYKRPIGLSLSSLPVSELGQVTEALLNSSQILKRVNPDLETVGGPVDVVTISKGDGLVWIKRKHYFSPDLNHTFINRYLS